MTALSGRAGPAPRDMTCPATWTDCRVWLGGIRKGLPTAVMPPSRIGSEGRLSSLCSFRTLYFTPESVSPRRGFRVEVQ